MFALRPCDSAYAEAAHTCFDYSLQVPLSPDAAFSLISDTEREGLWFPDFRSADWLTPAPYGVGALREYRTRSLRAIELFTAWEPGKRLTFTFIALSLPLVRRFMEDYQLSGLPQGGTEIRWRVCFEPSALVAPVRRPLTKYFEADFARAARQLAALVGGQLVHRTTTTSSATGSSRGEGLPPLAPSAVGGERDG